MESAIRPPTLRLVAATEDRQGMDDHGEVRQVLAETLLFLRGQGEKLSRLPEGAFYAGLISVWSRFLEKALGRWRE
jgi:hypothetical protein